MESLVKPVRRRTPPVTSKNVRDHREIPGFRRANPPRGRAADLMMVARHVPSRHPSSQAPLRAFGASLFQSGCPGIGGVFVP
ncbi:hypothetical protein BX281_3639 [Streptomyces sp. Ag82_O1-15]|nr:hypothetical protein BX281_3639 [Streptomyces sp. Ag82_O1-15]